MPRRDGTGPMGQGAGTGRGFGNCAKSAVPFIVGAVAGICMGLAKRNRFGQKTKNQDFGVRQGQGRGFGQRFGQGQQS